MRKAVFLAVIALGFSGKQQVWAAPGEERSAVTETEQGAFILSDETRALAESGCAEEPVELLLSEISTDPVICQVSLTRDGHSVAMEEGKEYTVEAREGEGDWIIYVYRIAARNFQEKGTYQVVVSSRDPEGWEDSVRTVRLDFIMTGPKSSAGDRQEGTAGQKEEGRNELREPEETDEEETVISKEPEEIGEEGTMISEGQEGTSEGGTTITEGLDETGKEGALTPEDQKRRKSLPAAAGTAAGGLLVLLFLIGKKKK